MLRGIDVSSYQRKIDWTKVKPYIDFAIIRCGYGNDLRRQDDIYFERKFCGSFILKPRFRFRKTRDVLLLQE